MVYVAGKARSLEDAREDVNEAMKMVKRLETFKTFLSAQGGDASVIDHPEKLPQAKYKFELEAKETVTCRKSLQMKSEQQQCF